MNKWNCQIPSVGIGGFLALAAISLGSVGCELTPEERQALQDAITIGEAAPGYEGGTTPISDRCYLERHTQPDETRAGKLDLLFVIDSSGSLDTERGMVADGLDALIQELPAGVDYNVAVMLGHGSRSSYHGRLFTTGGRGPVLSSTSSTLATIRTNLRYLVTHTINDTYSDGGEEGMFSLYKGLEGAKLAASRTKNFFREDAALAVVFITDENDICATFPAGVTPVRDPENLEGPAKARDCAGITPASVLDRIRSVQGEKPFLVTAVAYNTLSTIPRDGENEYAYGTLDLVALANGASVDLATRTYNQGLARIGVLAARRLALLTDFPLSQQRVDPPTIDVQVDGRGAPFIYDPARNEVHVPEPGSARSVVEIGYCLENGQVEPSPTPSPSPSPDPSPTPTGTASPGPSPTPTPTGTASPAPSPTPTGTASPSPSPTPSASPEPDPSPTPCEGPSCGVIGT